MSNGVTIQQSNALTGTVSSRALAYVQKNNLKASSELSGGITGGFGVVGYRGKVWRIKYQGNEQAVERQSPAGNFREPVPAIPVVIIAATPHITKTFYENGYVEGSNSPPDCASSNGVVPDATVPKKQANLCATCPHNQFGSRTSQDGKGRGKACADAKRLAVVPSGDILNEAMGGPMLLRIPAASLSELQKYAGELERQGLPFFAVGTWLRFDGDDAYPKILFSGERVLSDDEFTVIEQYRDGEQVKRILNSIDVDGAAPAAEPAPVAETPMFSATMPGDTAPAPAAQPAPQPTPAPVAQPATVTQAETPDQMRARIRAEMEAEARAEAEAAAKAQAEARAKAEAQARAEAEAAAKASLPPAETEAEMRARIKAEMLAEAQGAAQTPAPVAQAAPTPAPQAEVAQPTPQPAPAAAEASVAPGAVSADGDFTSYLDDLMAGA